MKATATLIQARTGSTRLPGKVLMNLGDRPALVRVVERVRLCGRAGEIVVVTSTESRDDAIEALCRQIGTRCFRGSELDVLDRYYRCATELGAGVVVRVTADCPLLVPEWLDRVVEAHLQNEAAYSVMDQGPTGTVAESISIAALGIAWEKARAPREREHVVYYVTERPTQFRSVALTPEDPALRRPDIRLTLDTLTDYRLLSTIYSAFSDQIHQTSLAEILRFVEGDTQLREWAREKRPAIPAGSAKR